MSHHYDDEPAERLYCPWLATGGPLLPGMLVRTRDDHRYRVVHVYDDGRCVGTMRAPAGYFHEELGRDVALVVTDAATVGAMLGAVRKAWGGIAHLVLHDTHDSDGEGGTKPACWWALAVGLSSVPFTVRYTDEYGAGVRFLCGPTEPEALIAAWKARPKGGTP